MTEPGFIDKIDPLEKPRQIAGSSRKKTLTEVDRLIQGALARSTFGVAGNGLCVAVLDTGLNVTHVDFKDKVPTQVNFTGDNKGHIDDATDGQGHGTNVGGIVVAKGDHLGVAPGANIIPIKVITNANSAGFDIIAKGLQWVMDNAAQYRISVVCMSLGNPENYTKDNQFSKRQLTKNIIALKAMDIPVCIAAGNNYFIHRKQGMSYPAVVQECISVGAVYDLNEGPQTYASGAKAYFTSCDQMAAFSQRLHRSVSKDCYTNLFAPGAVVRSSGIDDDHGESIQQGTSQATPVVAGVILLVQEYFLKRSQGALPTVDQLVRWLSDSAITINDNGDDAQDNVPNTGLEFKRVSALAALEYVSAQASIGD